MGLDMHLVQKRKHKRLTYENTEELIYWRKANAVHKFFVDKCCNGIDDCSYGEVKKKDLEELRDICSEILKKATTEKARVVISKTYNIDKKEWEPQYADGEIITNSEICEELLPTQAGFFFGSTEYDNYYLEDIRYTLEQINKVLESTDFKNYKLYYTSSW